MNELLLAMVIGSKGFDKSRFASYLREERSKREKDFAKIARALVFGGYWLTGSLKLKATVAGNTVDATDAQVSIPAKLDALLNGEAELWKAIPYFGFLNEIATFVGEVVARASTMDPALIELIANNTSMNQPQTITLQQAPPPRSVPVGQTLTLRAPTGQSTPVRVTANGLEIMNPDWSVTVD